MKFARVVLWLVLGGCMLCSAGAAGQQQPQAVVPRHCYDSCREEGRCQPLGAQCIAVDSALCARSNAGREQGLTIAIEGRCEALTEQACRQSTVCREHDRCFPNAGRCVERPYSQTMRVAGILSLSLGAGSLLGGAVMALIAVGGEQPGWLWPASMSFVSTGAGGMLFAGVPLLVIGKRRIKTRDEELGSVRLRFSPVGASLEVSY